MKKKKQFNSEQNAKNFAKKVNGKLNDLREIETAKSKFSVTYEKQNHHKQQAEDWSPEDDRDFGYPNNYWK
jgi:hypothetical protein